MIEFLRIFCGTGFKKPVVWVLGVAVVVANTGTLFLRVLLNNLMISQVDVLF